MNGDIALQDFPTRRNQPFDRNNSQNEHTLGQQVAAGGEDQSSHDTNEATEDSHLLPADQSNEVHRFQRGGTGKRSFVVVITLEKAPQAEPGLLNSAGDPLLVQELNGAAASCEAVDGALCSPGGPYHRSVHGPRDDPEQAECENRFWGEGLQRRLNREVVGRLRLWMVIAFLLLLAGIAIVTLGLVLWSVLYEDEDDKFDRKTFVVPLFYNGSLRLVNQKFTDDLLSPMSNHSQALSTELEEKLYHLYSSSPALGRYFSGTGIYAFRNGSVTAYYWLKFSMPREHEQLLRFTLSREMVYNVLRQHLYDQDPESDPLFYIDPAAIYMQAGNMTISD